MRDDPRRAIPTELTSDKDAVRQAAMRDELRALRQFADEIALHDMLKPARQSYRALRELVIDTQSGARIAATHELVEALVEVWRRLRWVLPDAPDPDAVLRQFPLLSPFRSYEELTDDKVFAWVEVVHQGRIPQPWPSVAPQREHALDIARHDNGLLSFHTFDELYTAARRVIAEQCAKKAPLPLTEENVASYVGLSSKGIWELLKRLDSERRQSGAQGEPIDWPHFRDRLYQDFPEVRRVKPLRAKTR